VSESNKRSILKSISWHVSHVCIAATVAFIVTGSIQIAALLASAELLWESAAYFLHERAWAKFGKNIK
jgi:uncharacterized membrane protein